MTYYDPVFEARKNALLGGNNNPPSPGVNPTVAPKTNTFSDPSFEARKAQVIKQYSASPTQSPTAPTSGVDFAKPPEEKKSGNIFSKVANEVGKFAVRTGVEAANLATETLDFAADFLASGLERTIRNQSVVGIGPIATKSDKEARNNLADKWRNFYDTKAGQPTEKIKQFTENLRNIDYIKPSEEWSNASTVEKLTKKLPETILNIGPGIVSSLGSFALNPTVGYVTSVGTTADDVRNIAEENGVSKGKAETLGLATGILVGWLDKIVPDEIFSPEQKKEFIGALAKRVVKTGLKEAGTEMAQEDVQLLVEATLRKDLTWDEVFSRNAMSGLGGLIGGAGADTIVGFVNGINRGDIADVKNTETKATTEAQQTAEVKPEEVINKVVNTPAENTPEGQTAVKAAVEAQNAGTNVNVDPKILEKINEAQPEQKKVVTEEERYKDFPEKLIVEKPEDYKGILPDNIVHFNQGQNPRVTLILPADDKVLIEAAAQLNKQGAEASKKFKEKLEYIIATKSLSREDAVKTIIETYNKYRGIAKENADPNSQVIVNTIPKPVEVKVEAPPTENQPINPPNEAPAQELPDIARRGEKTSLNKELDGLIGYESSGAHFGQEYGIRRALIDEAYNSAPPEVIDRMDQILTRLDDIQSGKIPTEPTKTQINQIADAAYKQTVANGGVTISLAGDQPAKGYAYAPAKNTEVKILSTEFKKSDIVDFITKNDRLLSVKGNNLGLWVDNGYTYIDVSRVGEANEITLEEAAQAQQEAVFDLEKFETIYTRYHNEKISSDSINTGESAGAGSGGSTEGAQQVQGSEQASQDGSLGSSVEERVKETPKEIPGSELQPDQKPIGTGKEKESRAYSRIKERYSDIVKDDVTYNPLKLEQDVQNAINFVAEKPNEALEVAFGLKPPPPGQTETAIAITLADKALRDGNIPLWKQLEGSRSLRQTRRGQEIVSERGRFNDDSPHRYLAEVLDARLKNIGSSIKQEVVDTFKKSQSAAKRAMEKIDTQVEKISQEMKVAKKKIALAQDIIESLRCK